jgi:cytochrome c biogenesis protein CcmG/thiol:disulfide interchange protein DsbE
VPGGLVLATMRGGDGPADAGGRSPDLRRVPGPGDRAPDFTLRTLDGGTVSLSGYRGRPVVLTFFASWCHPCELETAHLERAWRQHRSERLAVVGIMWRDLEQDARPFLRRLGATYPALVDPGERVARAYRIPTVPVTLFIDPAGTIVARDYGLTKAEDFDPLLDRLLAASR